MRVLFDALGLPTHGGAKSSALGWIRSMAKQAANHQFVVALSRYEPALEGQSNLEQLVAPVSGRFSVRIWGQARLPQIVRARRMDLAHFTKNHGCFLMPCPSVLTINDLNRLHYPAMFSRIDVAYWRTVQKALLRQVSQIIAISENTKQDLMDFYDLPSGKIHVVYPGISPRFRPWEGITEAMLEVYHKYGIHPPYVLSVGGMAMHKNVYTALRAFSALLDHGYLTDYMFVVAGGRFHTHNDQRLVDLVSRHNERRIWLAGEISDEDLPFIYAGASLFVYPSLYEGFGIAPLEAMACGVPVLSSRAGSLPEVLADAAWMVDDATDVDAFAEAMLKLLSDRRTWNRFKERGLKRASHFSWSDTAQRTLELYHRVVQSQRDTLLGRG